MMPLLAGVKGIQVVLFDSCGSNYTYELDGQDASYIGEGDLHDARYNFLEVETSFAPTLLKNTTDPNMYCIYRMKIYPTVALENHFKTKHPVLYCMVVIAIFVFTAMIFVLYDYLVQRRQNVVMATAKRTNAIVSSLFPRNVRDRILEDAREQAIKETKLNKITLFSTAPRTQLKSFLDENNGDGNKLQASKPIADLFAETTVLFGDIVGFTAWSSVREPTQVFMLLETIYHAFDEIASRRRVFKVETIGDCYVAVTGLPEPQKEHAVIMARFARDILLRMRVLTQNLEVSLGPDTRDLSMRIGLHSGPVTAGVLRGQKSRFQLFGDTVNTASRMESTGERGKIHLSSDTARLLMDIGKAHWVIPRDQIVQAKGKGEMITYWLELNPSSRPSTSHSVSETSASHHESVGENENEHEKSEAADTSGLDNKTARLIDWNADILVKVIKCIVARRSSAPHRDMSAVDEAVSFHKRHETILDEVKDIIQLPKFDISCVGQDPSSIVLDQEVISQTRSLVANCKWFVGRNRYCIFSRIPHHTISRSCCLVR
jgi:class 3 adenylate cyclase